MNYDRTISFSTSIAGSVDVEDAPSTEVFTYDLQTFAFTGPTECAALYLGQVSGSVSVQNGSVRLARGARASFDTYLNSFYEAYWLEHTTVDDVSLCLSGSGRVRCTVVREAPGGRRSRVAESWIDLGQRQTCVGVQSSGRADEAGRLFVELEAATSAVIETLSWTTTAVPLREVAIGVGACTFNREPFLTRTLEALLRAPPSAAVRSVVVVNQGEALHSGDFRVLQSRETSRLRVVEQKNLGGSGGFTRSAMELLQDPHVTHILFMDDDIAFDACHLPTAVAFLRYAKKPLVLGGQMLDLFKPTMMFEAGCAVTQDNLLEAQHRDLDLTDRESLAALAEVMDPDFNGWWFSIIPAECFRTHGLPLPIFIRGDDQEYGLRLRRGGVPTVSLPPVCVWHEPFYAKPPGWQLYYDLRNRLILASLHPDRISLDSPVSLLKRLWAMIIRYDYQHTWIMILAIEDFLKGPKLLEEGAPETHLRVTKTLVRHAPMAMDGPGQLPLAALDSPVNRNKQRTRLIASFLRALVGAPRPNSHGKVCLMFPEMPLELMHVGRSYVLGGTERHFFLKFSYSFFLTWRQLGTTLSSIARYGHHSARAADLWRRAQPDMVSFQGWSARFGPPTA